MQEQKLILTDVWDKTFPQSNKVAHRKGNLSQPLRRNLGCRYVHAQKR